MSAQNNEKRQIVEVQVVLEYQWTASRDLINDVKAEQISSATCEDSNLSPSEANENVSKVVTDSVSLASIIDSLSKKGFDLEADQRVSYRDPAKSLYCYIGKASDQELVQAYKIPKTAFALEDGQSVLTLLIREGSSGFSGSKKPVLISQATFGSDVHNLETVRPVFEAGPGLAQASQFAKQTHALLGSQSFQDGAQATSDPSGVRLDLSGTKLLRNNTFEPAAVASSQANVSSYLLDPNDIKRTKERQIRFVVERVSLWRKLYNGVELGNGETVRYSLEDSAKLVGISKKSLDDYLLQLRFGRMYGFDFLRHQCDNIGVLRKFVREHKNKQKRQAQKQSVKDEESSHEDVDAKTNGDNTPTGKQLPEVEHAMVDETTPECPKVSN